MDTIFSSISSQLWRYYDLDIDVTSIEQVGEHEYQIVGDTENSSCVCYFIRCKLFWDKVEDLFLFDGVEYIEPTTTLEEQQTR
jgi:hypothetical protein